MISHTPKGKGRRKSKAKELTLIEHFEKGAQHWNEFVRSFEGDVLDLSSLVLNGGRYDLAEFEFPLPVSLVDCVFKEQIHIENAHFDNWIDLTGAKFARGILIEGSIFEGELIFESARCKGGLDISNCEFKERANFDDFDAYGRVRIADSTFLGAASFSEFGAFSGLIVSDTRFNGDVTFAGQFHREALFFGNKFEGFVDFNYAHFKAPFYFRANEFRWRPAIDDIDLTYEPFLPSDKGYGAPLRYMHWLHRLSFLGEWLPSTIAKTLFIAKTNEQYPTLRQFRLFAREYDDHRLALDIYALELKSRRLWYDPILSGGFIVGLAYQILSDFGRSMLRPFIALMVSFVVFAGIFFAIGSSTECIGAEKIRAGVLISLSNVIPIAGWQKYGTFSAAEACLFGRDGLSLAYGALSMAQASISVMLVFLLVLALRNAVKMSR